MDNNDTEAEEEDYDREVQGRPLPFTQTNQEEILCINIKLQNLTWRENDPL